uniref:Uncharacterized protein n=1 Tax=viral metagenome TaxID=1070528 RepID=A0A6C0J6Y4_9ZZZZ
MTQWGVAIPKCFLDHILSEGYIPGEHLFAIKLTSPYNNLCNYYPVIDTFMNNEHLVISERINSSLNLIDDIYIETQILNSDDIVKLFYSDVTVTLQAYNESFGAIMDAKDKLTDLCISIRLLNAGNIIYLENEPILVVSIINSETKENINTILTYTNNIDSEIKIKLDFKETIESQTIKLKAKHKAELEARGFKGEGHAIGGQKREYNPSKAREARMEWLERLDKKVSKSNKS